MCFPNAESGAVPALGSRRVAGRYDALANEMQRQGLITLQDDECISTRRILAHYSCWPQARAKAATLCHYLLAVERQPVD